MPAGRDVTFFVACLHRCELQDTSNLLNRRLRAEIIKRTLLLLFEMPVIRKKNKWAMYMGGMLFLVDGQDAVARPLDRTGARRKISWGKGECMLNTAVFFA